MTSFLILTRNCFIPSPFFAEVPSRLLRPEDWNVVSKYPVYSPQFIIKLEGKALFFAVKHALRFAANFGCRLSLLVDCMSLCLASTKGRSSSPNLLHVGRKFACLSLATNMRIVTRAIPSELNIADGPSRGLNSLQVAIILFILYTTT